MEPRSLLRRFTLLQTLRWLPTGLAAPVLVLLPHERGLELGQIGMAFALYNAVVVVLELPTGGWADRWGARPVLLASAAAHTLGLAGLVAAHDLGILLFAATALGVGRALGSGPLEAWAVTRLLQDGAANLVETALARASMVEGIALAAGALVVVVLPATTATFLTPLALPVAVAIGVGVVHAGAIAVLIRGRPDPRALEVAEVPAIRFVLQAARRTPALRGILLVVALNAVALVAVEMLWQPRFEQLFATDEATLVRLLALLAAAGFAATAAGAFVSPLVRRWTGSHQRTAAIAQLLQAGSLAVLAGAGHPLLAATAFLATHLALGAFHPAMNHQLHALARDGHRATLVSAGSLSLQLGAVASQLTITNLAGATSIPVAWVVAAGVVVLAAGLQARAPA